jgi:VWFA-related protein
MRNKSLYAALMILGLTCISLFSKSPVQAQSSGKKQAQPGNSIPTLKRSTPRTDKHAAEVPQKREQQSSSSEEDVLKVETSLVVADVLVFDKQGKTVLGLTQNDFLITEDGTEQQISTFSLGDDRGIPRSIVLIMDYSASMLPYIEMSVEAAKVLVDKLGPRDSMAIVTDDLALLSDFTGDKDQLKSRLESIKEKANANPPQLSWLAGHSLQFSALLATLREMFDDEDVRPVIIFQTDGDELEMLQPKPDPARRKSSPFSLKDVYGAAEKSRATIYSVIPGAQFAGLSKDQQMKLMLQYERASIAQNPNNSGLLQKKGAQIWIAPGRIESRINEQEAVAGIAEFTGGRVEFLEDPAQAPGIYARILASINQRYVITYYPTNKQHDGKRRTVRIEVRGHPELTVWGRKSYLASGTDK